jgi:hypothetical protein
VSTVSGASSLQDTMVLQPISLAALTMAIAADVVPTLSKRICQDGQKISNTTQTTQI